MINRSPLSPLEQRFFQYVLCGTAQHECWTWTGAKSRQGYGNFCLDGRTVLAHRVSWQLHKSADAGNMAVCHSCDNPSCVNPDHLWLGTVGDNNADRHTKGRSNGASLKGTANPMSQLTPEIVRAIRSDRRKLADVAADYGITFQTVSNIRLRNTWKHV